MLDKTLPYYEVTMLKKSPDTYPRFALPQGYRLCAMGDYPGPFAQDWARLLVSVEEMPTLQEGVAYFDREFGCRLQEARKRCLFVLDAGGRPAATASLWQGDELGRDLPRIHWVATAPAHQGRGLCKAVLTGVMDLYHTLGLSGPVFLTTQTWSYKAIGIYRTFGFEACPHPGRAPEKDALAWGLIGDKLAAYRGPSKV
nr:GNAT family N-acetyltransferase [bacterium]